MRKGDSDKENCKHLVFIVQAFYRPSFYRPSFSARQFFSYSGGPFISIRVFEGSLLSWQNHFLMEFKSEANVGINSISSLHSFWGVVGDGCWWRIVDGFDHFGHQHHLSYRRAPTFKRCHQLGNSVTNSRSPI